MAEGPNLYAYVLSNSVNKFDALGLVTWTGSIRILSIGYGPKVGRFRIQILSRNEITLDLESECLNGKKVEALIRSVDPDSNGGRHIPINIFFGSVELKDNLSTPDGSALEGAFSMELSSLVTGTGSIKSGAGHGTFSGTGFSFGSFSFEGVSSLVYPPKIKSCTCPVSK